MKTTLVSALMVTRDRVALARRAIACLANQTWPDLELVVVDDGEEDYRPALAALAGRAEVQHLRLAPEPGRRLGALRNLALEAARGELCVQWDDDEWYHPERIAAQVAALEAARATAVVLHHTLQHIDAPGLASKAFRGFCYGGTPGTVLHRRSDARYPNLGRGEDTAFLHALARRGRVVRLRHAAHLFIRCFHGGNTWGVAQFTERLRRTPLGWLRWWWARWVRRDLTAHPAFRLRSSEVAAVTRFLAESRALGLVRSRAQEVTSDHGSAASSASDMITSPARE